MGHYGKYNVAIIGFGIEGQDATRYFLGQGSKITIFDKKPIENLNTAGFLDKNINWVTGEDYLEKGLLNFDIIVRSPGFYRFSPVLLDAEKNGALITSNTKLFFKESEANIIGITGTKGKGSTARMLQAALQFSGYKTLLLGNIGEPMLDRISDADTFDYVILELSSFQLIDLDISPQIAICSNVTVDHLDWHKDREEYVSAKENLWKYQSKNNYTIFNAEDQTLQSLAHDCPGTILWSSLRTDPGKGSYVLNENIYVEIKEKIEVGKAGDLQVVGQHNLLNSLLALSAAVVAGADPRKAWKGISKYKGYEHRLEIVGKSNGVTFVNDSASTNPESTIAAINSFDNPIVLIVGGSRKGHTFSELAKNIVQKKVKTTVLIGETQDEIAKELDLAGYTGSVLQNFDSAEDAFQKAVEQARDGDFVILSPACASFGLFKDYKERGERFKKIVLKS